MDDRSSDKDAERARQTDGLTPITVPYLLVIGIPCFVDSAGRRWVDGLWHKDLVEHVKYLSNFTLASPLRRLPPPAGARCLTDDPLFAAVRYVDLPASDSELAGIRNWPRTFITLWRAVGRAEIVHAGVADWPIPTGWAATLAAKLRRRALLLNIESAFWRTPRTASFKNRSRSWLWERVNRWCVRHADLPLFTHHEYARQMLRDPSRGYVFQASWIDNDNLLDEDAAKQSWDAKEANPSLRVLFAGRLVPEKGVEDLLDAVATADIPVHLDVIGSGELAGVVREAERLDDRIRLLPPTPYDASFFELVRKYHALVLANRTDEQPRVAYDAYSQAVPVLATATPGNAECVIEGETGYLSPPGDKKALLSLLEKAHSDRAALRRMGMRSLLVARGYTHQEMHRRRWQLLDRFIRGK